MKRRAFLKAAPAGIVGSALHYPGLSPGCGASVQPPAAVDVAARNPQADLAQAVEGATRFTVLTPNCIRMEYAPKYGFVDAPSLFALRRDCLHAKAKICRAAGILTIDTGKLRLHYRPDGKAFNKGNLQVSFCSTGTVWHPEKKNLGGPVPTLDGIGAPFPLPDGLLSRDGWYLLDDSGRPLVVDGWTTQRIGGGPRAPGMPSGVNPDTDWYLFLGDHLIAAPITVSGEGAEFVAQKKVWLPAGTWYNLTKAEKLQGDQVVTTSAALNEIPVYARGGVPLPMQPSTTRMTSTTLTTLVVRCYPGIAGESFLYEDDRRTQGYMQNHFSRTSLSYRNERGHIKVSIAGAIGIYQGQPARRCYRIELPWTQQAKFAFVNGRSASISTMRKVGRMFSKQIYSRLPKLLRLRFMRMNGSDLHLAGYAGTTNGGIS